MKSFSAQVERDTNGEVKIELHNNQSLVKAEEIPNAVRRGQVALGQIYLANLGNQDRMFTLDAVPFLAPTEEDAVKLWEAQRSYFESWFAERGMRMLFAQFFPPQGFYANKPVEKAADLAGLRLRIYSDATKRMAELLGAQPVQVQFGEVPQAFATGLVNAMFTSPQTGLDSQAWDFVKTFSLVGAMRTKVITVINENEFQRLPEAHRNALLEAAKAAELQGLIDAQNATSTQLDTLREHGITVDETPSTLIEELKDIGRQMTEEWMNDASEEQKKVLTSYKPM